ncbi:Retrovirus-related Pol polyprotein from transposon 17.6 [Vitis vinifera]|uniref:Retrovirus-related Pol polyprotein from transposon 17.6 n=1 Tax=Vitis vinifera TaxID=29760 RepID=A0A438GT14_VITVI|nr:Retrovirus-related Pol polyprotein from transposon 17.6 [Vitis vinifera]
MRLTSCGNRIHHRSGVSGLVGKCSGDTQKGRQMIKFGFHCWARDALHFGRLLQIPPNPHVPADEEKTAFITPHGLYCYKVMPFGLKNASATYQRLMTKIFKPLVGRTVEVYIDDIVVKSKTEEEHVLHLQEVFHLLRKYDMKLNPSKCAFGVSVGKFLGFMVSQRGIEVSPDQVKAVMETPPPRSKKELQRLTGKLVALGRFIARFIDELRPFFLAIRKARASGWTDIYGANDLGFRSAAQKLRPYFQAHPVVVLTDQPLRNILHKSRLTGRMLQWAIELSEYGIEFQPSEKEWWTLRVDGASRSSGSEVGLLLQSPTGEHLEQAIRLGFPASNNEVEYEAILSGLDLALAYPSPGSRSIVIPNSCLAPQCLACSAKTLVTQKLKKLGRQLLKEWKLSLTQGNLYKCLDAHLLGALAK